jgi:glycosyltransferase involved in cell wall biosynthesis
MLSSPTVSVLMLAFNHAGYIEQAIQSVVSQETSFEVELLIGEDCSSDQTLEKCKRARDEHPELIRLISDETNVGVFQNFQRLMDAAKSQYIAILEGDDYWIDDQKLEKQISYLRDHPEYFWCASRTRNKEFVGPAKESYSLSDVLRRYLFHTSSIVFRSEPKMQLPSNLDTNCLDVILYARLCEESPCGFLDEELSFYRRHDGGIWTGASIEDRLIETWKVCDFFLGRYGSQFLAEIYERELWIYKQQVSNSDKSVIRDWRNLTVLMTATRMRIRETYGGKYLHYQLSMMGHGIKLSYASFRQQLALRRRLGFLFGRTKHD